MAKWIDDHFLFVWLVCCIATGVVLIFILITVGNEANAQQLQRFIKACQTVAELTVQKCELLWRLK